MPIQFFSIPEHIRDSVIPKMHFSDFLKFHQCSLKSYSASKAVKRKFVIPSENVIVIDFSYLNKKVVTKFRFKTLRTDINELPVRFKDLVIDVVDTLSEELCPSLMHFIVNSTFSTKILALERISCSPKAIRSLYETGKIKRMLFRRLGDDISLLNVPYFTAFDSRITSTSINLLLKLLIDGKRDINECLINTVEPIQTEGILNGISHKKIPYPDGSTIDIERFEIGVFRSSSSAHSLTREAVQAALSGKRRINKTCQTILSFPSPNSTNASIARSVSHSKARFIPRSLSIDDVMRMVDSEDGDIIVLTDLVREESGISQSSQITSASCEDSSSSQIVVSKSFDTDFCATVRNTPRTMEAGHIAPSRPSVNSINEIEVIEEMEDRIALAQSAAIVNSVHFRSRDCGLSLIPEQLPSTVEEGDEPSEESNPLSPAEDSQSSRRSERRPLHTMLNYLSRRKTDRELPMS